MDTYFKMVSNATPARHSTSKNLPRQTLFLIDTANVVGIFHREVPTVAPINVLLSLKKGLLNLGYNVGFYMEKRAYNFAWRQSGTTTAEFEAFCKQELTWIYKEEDEADEALLQTAEVAESCVILSNDRYRDYRDRFGKVLDEGRVLPFEIVFDFFTKRVLIQIPRIKASIWIKGVTVEREGVGEVDTVEEELLSPELACIEPRIESTVTHRATQRYVSVYALRERANNHDPSAFDTLSVRYAMGEGVCRDYERSITLEARAIEAKKRAWQTSRRSKRQRANRPFLQVA